MKKIKTAFLWFTLSAFLKGYTLKHCILGVSTHLPKYMASPMGGGDPEEIDILQSDSLVSQW